MASASRRRTRCARSALACWYLVECHDAVDEAVDDLEPRAQPAKARHHVPLVARAHVRGVVLEHHVADLKKFDAWHLHRAATSVARDATWCEKKKKKGGWVGGGGKGA